MATILAAKDRDKAVLALRDIQGVLEYTRNPQYKELDEIIELFASRGLELVPIAKPQGLTPTEKAALAVPAPATAASIPAGISTNDLYWLETTIIGMYKAYKQQNRSGYVLTVDSLGKVLHILCRPLGIPFKL